MPMPASGVFETVVDSEQFAADHEGWRSENNEFPRVLGLGIRKLLDTLTAGEIDDAPLIMPDVAEARCNMGVFTRLLAELKPSPIGGDGELFDPAVLRSHQSDAVHEGRILRRKGAGTRSGIPYEAARRSMSRHI
jgi:hypothetical protein